VADYLQRSGCFFGAAGALVLALNEPWSGWGFALFRASNFCWIPYGLETAARGLVIMQIVMTGTSVLGVYRWLIETNTASKRRPGTTKVIPLPRRELSVRKASK